MSIPLHEQDTEQTPQVKSDLARGTDTLKCTDNQTDCNPVGQQEPVISQTPECPGGNMTEEVAYYLSDKSRLSWW